MKCGCVELESYRILKDGSIKGPHRTPGMCQATLKIWNMTIKCNWCQPGHGGQHHAMVLKNKISVDVAWARSTH